MVRMGPKARNGNLSEVTESVLFENYTVSHNIIAINSVQSKKTCYMNKIVLVWMNIKNTKKIFVDKLKTFMKISFI